MNRLYSKWVILLLVAVLGITVLPDQSVAQANIPAGTCTWDPTYNIPNNMQIITSIVTNITCILYGTAADASCASYDSVSQALFTSITGQSTFKLIAQATASLFLMIFAISFMLGIIQLSLIDFTIRAVKLSIVLLLVTGPAWDFFYSTVGYFFQNGTNWLIARSTQIALGTVPGIDVNQPFIIIDYAIATAFSAKMFVTIVAMFFTGPYGWLFGILMVLGMGSFVAALFQAVWIYLMSMVVRAFLFGLAPIFFPLMLFNRTRHLFDGWINQLVNSMLQPVMLFTFFSFFVVLVQAAMENILSVPICYMPGSGLFKGLPGDIMLPRPTIQGQPYGREWGWTGPVDFPNHKTFFIDIMDVLIFILLTQLAWRFNSIAINIAKELAGVSTTYNIPGAFTHLLSPRHAGVQRALHESDRVFDNLRDRPEARAAGAAAGRQVGGGAETRAPGAELPGARGGGPRN